MQSLRHAELRAARALHHLETLEERLNAFYASEPYSVERFDDPEHDRHIVRLRADDPDDEIFIIAGEVAHALRCALDNAVYSLAAFALNTIPDSTKLQWPVLEKPNPSMFKTQTAGLSPKARAIIESLQPYQLGVDPAYREHALWQIHKLDIIDKHRRIPIDIHGFAIHLPTAPRSLPNSSRDIERGVEVSLPLGSHIYEIRARPEPVRFGDEKEGVRVSINQLRRIHQIITQDIFPRLASCFA